MFYIYILCSEKSGKYYIGSTGNPKRRLIEHNESLRATYTSKFRPWKMVALFEIGESRSDAEKLERFIKNQKSKVLIEKLIDSEFEPTGKLAQLVRAPHMRD